MNVPSAEQQTIIDTIKNGHNVIVDACAGSGKSTTILSLAMQMPDTKFIQLTYNSSLRYEIRDKVKQLKMDNLLVHTYHSLAVGYYDSNAYTDTGMRRIVYQDTSLNSISTHFDVVVIDEAQDMTLLYYRFVKKFLSNNQNKIQIMILGDYKQGLYEFKGADIRFLTLGEHIWKDFELLKSDIFEKKTLKMSYRVTDQICDFVNNVMLSEKRMLSCRAGPKVTYIRRQSFQIEKIVINRILNLIAEGASPDEIFILSGSIKGQRVKKLENALVINNIPCYVPLFETDKMDERVIIGKVGLSTFHSVKGRQRKYVFVLGFDNNYFTFYGRDMDTNICPNTLYVAATRATQGLYLLESDNYATDRPLEFLKKSHIEMKKCDYIQFKGHHQTIFQDEEEMNINDNVIKKHIITPTELVKFISESVIETISPIIDRIFVKETGEPVVLDIPSVIETKKGFFEEVSDLNGIAIPCVYYDYLKEAFSETEEEFDNIPRGNVLFDVIDNAVDKMRMNDHIFLKEIVNSLPEKIETINDYLYVANVSVAVQETLYFKLKQIEPDEYNWLTDDMVMACKNRLREVIGPDCENTMPSIEDTIIHESCEEQHEKIDEFLSTIFDETRQFRFTGRVDLITETIAWELKCTSEITIEHLVQVIIYAWLWKMRHSYTEEYEEKVFKIFNIKTGEIMRLDASMDDLNTIITTLLKGKFQEPVKKTDEEFIEDCQNCI